MKLFTKQMLGILSAATVGLVAVLIVGQSGFIAPTSSNLSTYTITMNNETTNDWDFLSTNGYANKTEQFRYTNFSFDDSILNNTSGTKTLQLKASTGKVYNETAINGLISLSVSYSSTTNLVASFGNEINPSTSSFNIVSGQTYSLTEYAQNTYLSIKTGSSYAKISEIKITYSCIPVEQTTLTSLNITSLPYKTTYVVGNKLDTAGLVITANYSNGSSKVVTSECVLNPKNGDILNTIGTQTVTCTYTENDVTVNTSFAVEVNASTSEEISEIILTASPNEIEVGETTTINLEVVPSTASRSVTWSSSDNNIASVSSTGVVTGISEGRAIITATSTQNANVKDTIEITILDSNGVEPSVKTYTKVSETPSDWSGQYLIVYNNWAFDGSLTKLDAVNNYQTITIENDTIEEERDIYFTIKKLNDNTYSIQSASGYYIGCTGEKGLSSSLTQQYEHTISLGTDTLVNLTTTSGATLQFNNQNNQNRFRYYASDQQPITLYRNGTSSSGSEDEKTLSLSASKTTIKVDEAITLQVKSNFSTSVTFSSSNENIATVNDIGLVTGINVGSATITATSTIDETIKASITINVIDASEVHPEIIIVSNYKDTYNVGDTLDFSNVTVTGYYEDLSEIDVTDQCTFSPASGTLLTEAGTIIITCTYTPTGIPDSFEITVVGETQTLTKQDVKYDYHDLKQNGIYNTPAMPSTGNSKMLVVPIWFADSSNYINNVEKASIRSDIEEAYFGEANTSSLPWHSVKSYYETESKGTLNLSGEVTDWYETSYSSTTITSDQVDLLVEDVGNSLKQQLGSEYNSYDTDKDGYIDALILIYAAPYNTTDDDSPLWAYCFWLQQENYNINNPIANTYFWASYIFMYESGSDHIDAHTYIHEMGHVLGLDDYYDYAYQYGNNPAAGFSMQDYNVGSHDPFSQIALGWVEPYVPTEDITIEIESFQESGDVILLSPEWTGSPFDEYLLLELYTPTGLNAYDVNNPGTYISGADDIGIRLWHVDARLRRCYESGGYLYLDTNSYYTDFDAGDYYQIGPSNTTYVSNSYVDTSGYAAFVEEDQNYDLLALIRNSRANDDEMQDNLNSLMLFKAGDSFTMSSYSSQFPKGSVLNSGSSLGFSFEVLSIDKVNLTATIQIQKL